MIDSNLIVVEKSPVQRTILEQLKTLASLLDPGDQSTIFVTVRDWQKLFLEVKLTHPKVELTPAKFGNMFRIGGDKSGLLAVRNSGTEDQKVCDALNSQCFLPDHVIWKANNLRTG
jgi:hypothetical protein